MPTPETIARDYLAVWNQVDPNERLAQMAGGWTEAASYVDPMMAASGRRAICDMIEAARSKFPGLGFSLRGQPDSHSRFVRFSWDLGPEGGGAVAGGTDIVRLDDEGRIAEVVGFLDGASAG
jgi:hypothetical protein